MNPSATAGVASAAISPIFVQKIQAAPAKSPPEDVSCENDTPMSLQDIDQLLGNGKAARREKSDNALVADPPNPNGESKQPTSDTLPTVVYRSGDNAPLTIESTHGTLAPIVSYFKHSTPSTTFFVMLGSLIMLFQLLMHFSYERQHERALLAIERLGAKVSQTPEGGVAIDLGEGEVAQLLSLLKDVRDLQLLEMRHSGVSDAQLASLPPMRNLRELGLDDTSISDAGIDNLRGLESLGELRLRNTVVSAAKIAELLRRFPALNVVSNHKFRRAPNSRISLD
jgi:hypothetical protein